MATAIASDPFSKFSAITPTTEDSDLITFGGGEITTTSSQVPQQTKPRAAEYIYEMCLPIFPVYGVTSGKCDCGDPNCPHPGKHPYFKFAPHGFKSASRNLDDIDHWWTEYPNANIGIRCGGDLMVLDVDGPEGEATLARLEKELGHLPPTLQVNTGKGRHLYFIKPTGENITNSKPKSWDHLDVRADSGYVIGPGSTHVTGRTYCFEDERVPRAEIPSAWLKTIQVEPAKSSEATNSRGSITEGGRNEYLSNKAYSLKKTGLEGKTLFQAVNSLNHTHCIPPLPDGEVRAICKGKRYIQPDPLPQQMTTTGNLESKAISLAELSRMEFEPPKWVIEGLLPEGLTIMSSSPKVGKTWMAMELGLHVAIGRQVWGRFNVGEPQHVIYFGLEDNHRRFRYRIDQMCTDYEAPGNFLFLDNWDFGKAGREEIVAAIERNSTGLLIIDTLGCARMSDSDPIKKNVSPYQLDYEFVFKIKAMVRQSGASILMLHHNRKQNDPNDLFSNTSGSQGIFGGVDTSWQLIPRSRGSEHFTMAVTGKDVPDASWGLEWNKTTFAWRYVGASGEVFRTQTEQAILSAVGKEPLSPTKIHQMTGINVSTVKSALFKLVEKGLLVNDNGRYSEVI